MYRKIQTPERHRQARGEAEGPRTATGEPGRGDMGEGVLPGVVAELGELGPGAVISEAGLARLFNRHPASIKRAVERGELPRPCKLLGAPTWTVGAIVRHLEQRLAQVQVEAEKLAAKVQKLRP